MKKRNKKKKGFTLVELLVVIALIAILGVMLSVYVINSTRLSANIRKDYESLSEARIALSYITTVLRENDKKDVIVIDDNGKLIIKDKLEILHKDGKLREKSLVGEKDAPSIEIASISSFDISFAKDGNKQNTNEINIKVGYKKSSDATEELLEENITLRCLN